MKIKTNKIRCQNCGSENWEIMDINYKVFFLYLLFLLFLIITGLNIGTVVASHLSNHWQFVLLFTNAITFFLGTIFREQRV